MSRKNQTRVGWFLLGTFIGGWLLGGIMGGLTGFTRGAR